MSSTKVTLEHLKQARDEGRMAAAGDMPASANPYQSPSEPEELKDAWDDGYNRPMLESEEVFDPDEELATPPTDPDVPRDHPSNQPKPGDRPADK